MQKAQSGQLAIVQFRRLMLRSAADLAQGILPPAATEPDAYRVRSGALLADRETPLEQAMVENYAHPDWRVPETAMGSE